MLAHQEQILGAAKWGLSALAAAAVFGVSKIGLDRLGKGAGEYETQAFIGLGLFALGVATLVATFLWMQGRARTTVSDLLSDRFGSTGKKVRRRLEGHGVLARPAYLYAGYGSIQEFVEHFNDAVQSQTSDLSQPVDEVEYLQDVRYALLTTAARDRATVVGGRAAPIFILAAVMTVLGTGLYAWSVNRDEVLRTDRIAAAANTSTGTLLPKASTPISLRIPDSETDLRARLGPTCDAKSVPAIALEIGTEPGATGDKLARVVHAITERTETCSVQDLWVPPSWVTVRPPASDSSPSTTSTTEPSESSNGPN